MKKTVTIEISIRTLRRSLILSLLITGAVTSTHSSLRAQGDPQTGSRGSRVVWVESATVAEPWINRITVATSAEPEYRYWKGMIEILEGDASEGALLMESALPEVAVEMPAVHLYLGIGYSKLGREQAMCAAFRQYLQTQASRDFSDIVEIQIGEHC